MMTPNTVCCPAPAPSDASDRAKQLASFSIRTGRPSTAARSWSRARPFRASELEFFTSPVAGLMTPGMPMPTVTGPTAVSACATAPASARTESSYTEGVGTRRRSSTSPAGSSTTCSIFVPPKSMPMRSAMPSLPCRRRGRTAG